MNTAIRIICFTLLLSAFPVRTAAEDFTNAIHAYLQHRGEFEKRAGGIVVGIVDEHGISIISYGQLDNGTDQEVNADTVFNIYSQTCVYTALLLEDMIERREMSLDDPVAKYLPKAVKMPTYNGRKITMRHLETESSGLPRGPDDLSPRLADNPLADYSVEKMYAFLSGYQLTGEPGVKFAHGGMDMGLLGHVIGLKAGTNYESLVVDRICQPLKMDSTRFTLLPELKSRLALRHNLAGYQIPDLDMGVMVPLNGLHSTANDLLKFVSANLGSMPSSLTPLMEKSVPHFVWNNSQESEKGIVQFGGGGFSGNSAYTGFDKNRRRGVVVLSTSDDGRYNALAIGKFLLGGCEWESDRRPGESKINRYVYSSYVGQYQAISNSTPHQFKLWPFSRQKDRNPSQSNIGISCEGDRLFIQVTGSRSWPIDTLLPPGACELLPQSETNFFERLSSRPVTFSRNRQGKVTGLTMDYQGKVFSYGKTTDGPPKAPEPLKPRVAIKLDTKLLDACVGRYEYPPNTLVPDGMIVKIWREGDHLAGQSWDKKGSSGAVEIYPESETNFFLKLDGSQDRFIKNEKGEVTAVIHHVEGHPDVEGRKLRTE